AVRSIDVAEPHDRDDAGDDEEAAGHDSAERAMHQPADIGRKLLRLGAGQQHAIVERMQKARFGNPLFLVDDDTMHHCDLTGGPSEAEQRNAKPDMERLTERDAVLRLGSISLIDRKLSHSISPSCGALLAVPWPPAVMLDGCGTRC